MDLVLLSSVGRENGIDKGFSPVYSNSPAINTMQSTEVGCDQ